MAYIVNTTEATPATTGTSYVLSIGSHASGDVRRYSGALTNPMDIGINVLPEFEPGDIEISES